MQWDGSHSNYTVLMSHNMKSSHGWAAITLSSKDAEQYNQKTKLKKTNRLNFEVLHQDLIVMWVGNSYYLQLGSNVTKRLDLLLIFTPSIINHIKDSNQLSYSKSLSLLWKTTPQKRGKIKPVETGMTLKDLH